MPAQVFLGLSDGVVLLTLWSAAAQCHARLVKMLEDAEDGVFPMISVEKVSVRKLRGPPGVQLDMAKLDSTLETKVVISAGSGLQIYQNQALVMSDFQHLSGWKERGEQIDSNQNCFAMSKFIFV